MKKALLLLLAVLFISCSIDTIDRVYFDEDIEKIYWNTSGGGQLEFHIEKNNSDFLITVHSKDYLEYEDMNFTLTSSDLTIYQLVNGIFSKEIDLYDHTFIPDDLLLGGSWTEITIYYGNNLVVIENIDTSNLYSLYNYVSEQIQ